MKKVLLASLLMVLSACSFNNNGSGGSSGSSPLDGAYRACITSQSGDFGDTLLTFSGSNFTTTTVYYSGAGCTGSNLGSESSTGTFTLSGSNDIDYAYANSSTIYDIYELSGNNLSVGDRSGVNNGSSAATRPTAYNTSFTYTRQ
jgi:hypothetical protein